jgi:hypothetical protein
VTSRREPLITSDNPVFKYNAFCEGVTWSGVTGARCSGLQLFLPLAPSHLLMLYDQKIYKTNTRSAGFTSEATSTDVATLNMLQGIAAHRNLYSNVVDDSRLRVAAVSGRRYRGSKRPITIESVNDLDPLESLIHQYERMPNIGLKLSFMSVRRRARRISVADRARMFRDGDTSNFGLIGRRPSSGARRFSVRREI